MIIDDLITDRTQEDIRNRTEKGFYMASDLNRVEGAVQYISAQAVSVLQSLETRAAELGVTLRNVCNIPYTYDDMNLETKQDWDDLSVPLVNESRRYLGNVEALCTALGCSTDTLPQSLGHLRYYAANAIEECLKQCAANLDSIERAALEKLK